METIEIYRIKNNSDPFFRELEVRNNVSLHHVRYRDHSPDATSCVKALLHPDLQIMAYREVAPQGSIPVIPPAADRCEFLLEICLLHSTVGIEHVTDQALSQSVNDVEPVSSYHARGKKHVRDHPEASRKAQDPNEVHLIGSLPILFDLRGKQMHIVAALRQFFGEEPEVALAAPRG